MRTYQTYNLKYYPRTCAAPPFILNFTSISFTPFTSYTPCTSCPPCPHFSPSFPLSSDIPHYRNLFNGQEADNEVYGNGAILGYEYRMHDTRIGRFWSVDPLASKFPWNSAYAFAENRVVDGMELEGLEVFIRATRNTTNTRPVFFRETNNYARTEYGRLPSIRNTTTTTYRIATHNGMRATMSFPRFSYLETFHSPQGNNIPMSTNNIQAQVITLLGDGCQFYTTKIEDRVNTPSGYRTNTNTVITFVDLQKQVEFDRLQSAYEASFKKLLEQLPDPEVSFSTMNSSAQDLFRQAEKVRQAKEVLGPSPMDMLNRVLLNCEKTILSQEKKTIMLPEIRPAEE